MSKKVKSLTIGFALEQFPHLDEQTIRETLREKYPDTYQELKTITQEDLDYLKSVFGNEQPPALEPGNTTTEQVKEQATEPPKAITQAAPTSLREAVKNERANLEQLQNIRTIEAQNYEDLALQDETVERLYSQVDLIQETEDKFWERYWENRGEDAKERAITARQRIQKRRIQRAVNVAQELGKTTVQLAQKKEQHQQNMKEATSGDLDLIETFFQ